MKHTFTAKSGMNFGGCVVKPDGLVAVITTEVPLHNFFSAAKGTMLACDSVQMDPEPLVTRVAPAPPVTPAMETTTKGPAPKTTAKKPAAFGKGRR